MEQTHTFAHSNLQGPVPRAFQTRSTKQCGPTGSPPRLQISSDQEVGIGT